MIQKMRHWILDRLILRPTRHELELGDQIRHLIPLDGEPLRGHSLEILENQVGEPTDPLGSLVLKFPGTSGRAERSSTAPMLLNDGERGIVWTMNPPGYGRSDGKASLSKMVPAANAMAAHAIQSLDDPPRRIWLSGNSLGCCTALGLAAQWNFDCPIAGIVLRNPPQLNDVVMRIARRYPLGQLMNPVANSLVDAMHATNCIKQVEAPLLLIQCGADQLVPPPIQDQILANHSGEHQKVVLEGLNHHEIGDESAFAKIQSGLEWLLETSDSRRNAAKRSLDDEALAQV